MMDERLMRDSIELLKRINEVVGYPICDEDLKALQDNKNLDLFNKKLDILGQRLESILEKPI